MCNQEVKFKLFYETAMEQGADLIATGHYARVRIEGEPRSTQPHTFSESSGLDERSEPRDIPMSGLRAGGDPVSWSFPSSKPARIINDSEKGGAGCPRSASGQLLKARDEKKDQTYFLYRVGEEALGKTVFPVGGMMKTEVKELAKKYGLATATKKESMGICFVGSVGIREFLSEYVERQYGEIRDDKTDEVVGDHDGAIFFTIGQRHGLNVGGGLPYYVTRKDMDRNIVYVSSDLNSRELWREEVRLRDVHWINSGFRVSADMVYEARVRHQAPLVKVRLEEDGDELVVKFEDEQRAITAGQSVVVYDGEICCGGGIVK